MKSDTKNVIRINFNEVYLNIEDAEKLLKELKKVKITDDLEGKEIKVGNHTMIVESTYDHTQDFIENKEKYMLVSFKKR
jgi:hypothetical protein